MGITRFEETLMKCSALLAEARTIDAPENAQSVELMQPFFGFNKVLLRRENTADGQIIDTVVYFDNNRPTNDKHVFTVTFPENSGIYATYMVFQDENAEKLDADSAQRLQLYLTLLHGANERQCLSNDALFYRYHDPQTHHMNMNFFADRCDYYIRNHTIGNYVAMSVNICGFTNLNLAIGSKNCDIVLVEYMNFLKEGLGEDEVVSRNTGDEFALLIKKEHLAKILEKLSETQISYGRDVSQQVSVSSEAGIYVLDDEIDSYHHIIQAISAAMNAAKSSLHLQVAYYDKATAQATEKKKYYETRFDSAVADGELHVFFQPKVSLKDYKLIGAEALSRWIIDSKIVPPDDFIPVLEETSKICRLDFFVLDHVCKSISEWISHGVTPVKVSVNLSRKHLGNPNVVDDILNIIDKYKVPHRYIEIELTETTVDADFEALKSLVFGLRDRGIECSVDDFGTGYSSLSLIREVPFKVLKIDKSFLGGESDESDRKRAMMKHVIGMASDLGMECIAEGVERMDHVQLLKENRCYMAQGFLFNKPIPQEEFEIILSGQSDADHVEQINQNVG